MQIALGADHAGFHLKERVKEALVAMEHGVRDVGCASAEPADYPDFAEKVGALVAGGAVERGILICGTGLGMAMAANKVRGIRAAPARTLEEARLSREHNDANVLTLGARSTPPADALAIVQAWLGTRFEGGRHQRRIQKIAELERKQA